MSVKIALAGNPNSGKTTLFNALTGSNQFVGNWPGVTVEKKEGRLKRHKEVVVTDLPGIYSLSPYTLEEVVSRDYLLNERPDVILNIVDGTNIERNLYLTTQLLELGIPVLVAVNMMDVVNKSGDTLDTARLGTSLGCPVVEISALKGTGVSEAAEMAVALGEKKRAAPIHRFSQPVEQALAAIQARLAPDTPEELKRFLAVKLFERDEKIAQQMTGLPHVDDITSALEDARDDDAESIIASERYTYITALVAQCCVKQQRKGNLTISDKIDRVVTHRVLALPIFAVVMFLVYFVSVTTVGAWVTDWTNDGLFGDGWRFLGIGTPAYEEAVEAYETQLADLEEQGLLYEGMDEEAREQLLSDLSIEEPDPSAFGAWVPGVPGLVEQGLDAIHTADWLKGLLVEGIIAGVGAVLGFVPQMLVLFLFLAFLEACGYMARIAFIMDRIFRRFGLSGKSFIPILIGTGCGVPGIMASRTIENERDRRMTVMTTTFIPCGAKLPIIALIAGALFGGAWWVAPSAYFIGMAAIVCSGIILKKTKAFAGQVAPFVMELPAYHWPTVLNVLRSMWERGWAFIKKAGTIILLSSIVVWFLSRFGFVDGKFGMVEDLGDGLLAGLGRGVSWLFAPLGFGTWQATVATVTGLVAKENVVGTFGVLYGFAEVAEDGVEIWDTLRGSFTELSAYAFLVFNLLCAPCFAAIGAIRREMNSARWTWFAIGFQTVLAYAAALCVFQLGSWFADGSFGLGTVCALLVVIGFGYLLFRRDKNRVHGRREYARA